MQSFRRAVPHMGRWVGHHRALDACRARQGLNNPSFQASRRALRGYSSGNLAELKEILRISEEVKEALATNKPVVALESTIYTHGALGDDLDLEGIVRRNGGVPAVVGILGGVPTVGLTTDEVTQLVEGPPKPKKASRRDIAYLVGTGMAGQKMNGGTTIAGTMVLARLAGIRVFGTGGLGGVHRGGHVSFDISADLTELGRTRMAVICSGSKGFLDIPRTLEYLETQGVLVSTFADGRKGDIDFPAFWARESGIKSPFVVQDEEHAAAILLAQEKLNIETGLLFANPIPEEYAIPGEKMATIIEQAVREADEQGAHGSGNTPFILRKIRELTNEASVPANKALVQSNVERATRVATAVSRLVSEGPSALNTPVKRWNGLETPSNVAASIQNVTRATEYVSVNDANKHLVLAMADMDIFTNQSFSPTWTATIRSSKPKWLVVDGNWKDHDVRAWMQAGKQNGAKVAFEPVSKAKSARLFCAERGLESLGVFPHATVDLATPNQYELAAMHAAAEGNEYFSDSRWWSVVDAFGMRGARDRFVNITSTAMTDAGIPQQAIRLLPFIPTIITKLGSEGALLTTILTKDDPRLYDVAHKPFVLSRCINDNQDVGGVYMRMFPPVEQVTDVASVNGIGDTFLGTLVAGLAQGGQIQNLINVAQKAAVLTLRSPQSVSEKLGSLENELLAASSLP
ncbi:hypothetical protein ONZ43_g206 [Nemania bipapillata]|uniref:Uncharacterized protein n=1 Tax=Nemania bipapillata TaxID=110536 RepID=A0ACC2J8Z1_9PEZI|nr:hypothetical protein ONZ43_g206 [Nemania bipapillata]